MISPVVAAQRFGIACLLGAVLGLVYGLLRPLRPRLTWLADLIFVIAAFRAWLELSFAVCRGDIRLAYTAGLFLGCVLWESTAGKLLRPVFGNFWALVAKIFRIILLPFKIFMKKMKKYCIFLLLSLRKTITIKCNK